jgi:hypothetical protein
MLRRDMAAADPAMTAPAIPPYPIGKGIARDRGHHVSTIDWSDGGATVVCETCGAGEAGPTMIAALHRLEHNWDA